MIIAIVGLVAFLAGVVAVSIIIVITLVNLLDKGLDALDSLILRHSAPSHPPPFRLTTSNQIGEKRGYSKAKIDPTNIWVYFHKTINEIHHSLIVGIPRNNLFKKLLGWVYTQEDCHRKNNTETNETDFRYSNRFVPIKHIRSIVNKLRRGVNHDYTEPSL